MENRKKRTNYPHFIGVRLSDFELDRLDQNAKLLGISRSEYVRKLLIEKEIKNHIEIVADMDLSLIHIFIFILKFCLI